MAVRKEFDILYEAGVMNVQFDDPNFACKLVIQLRFASGSGV